VAPTLCPVESDGVVGRPLRGRLQVACYMHVGYLWTWSLALDTAGTLTATRSSAASTRWH
jgi:hypothetical protein